MTHHPFHCMLIDIIQWPTTCRNNWWAMKMKPLPIVLQLTCACAQSVEQPPVPNGGKVPQATKRAYRDSFDHRRMYLRVFTGCVMRVAFGLLGLCKRRNGVCLVHDNNNVIFHSLTLTTTLSYDAGSFPSHAISGNAIPQCNQHDTARFIFFLIYTHTYSLSLFLLNTSWMITFMQQLARFDAPC